MADLNIGNSSSNVVVNAKHNGSVTPQINNTYDLGTSALRWKNIYGNLNGNATSAEALTLYTSISRGKTVAQAKAQLRGKFKEISNKVGVICVPGSYVAQWYDDSKEYYDSHTNSFISLNPSYDNYTYGHFLVAQYGGSDLRHIGLDNGNWTTMKTLLDSSNYTSYTVTKTGSGASGTWGISISGNAATATKLATARTISLAGSVTGSGTFDGSGNLSITTTTNHTHSTATTSANGFMSSGDKAKLDGITASADAVSFSRSLTSGTKVGTITINGTGTDLYAPINTDTKNTTGSTDTSSKIFLVGATSQEANPQTYSDNQVYAQNGQLNGNSIRVAEKVTLQYDVTNECLNFVFN